MNKLVLKILVSCVISFIVFLIYLGTADFVVKPKIIESDYKVEENSFLLYFFYFFCLNSQANQLFGDNPTTRKKQK